MIGGLIRRNGNRVQLENRFEDHPSERAEVAAAFLDEARCPGARGLSEENKASCKRYAIGAFLRRTGAAAR